MQIDPPLLSALSALVGALIGGGASLAADRKIEAISAAVLGPASFQDLLGPIGDMTRGALLGFPRGVPITMCRSIFCPAQLIDLALSRRVLIVSPHQP